MNKITLFFLLLAYVTYALSYDIDTLGTEPYHHFDWLDEDEYSITIKYNANASPKPSKCCLWNGTNYCKGDCSGSDSVTCKFTGASCGADGDNPATKYYYALYCDDVVCATEKTDKGVNPGITDTMSVDVTVAVSRESYIRYSMVLLLSLLVL